MISIDELLIEFSYGVIAVQNGYIIHAVGYENMPSDIDLNHLTDELSEDEELGLVGVTDYTLHIVAGDDWINILKEYTS